MRRARYELLELLGQGGFGEVRRARMHGEDSFTREVAIKLLRPDADADAARRLRDEARLLGLLRHPAIVQVLELTNIDGRPAVVMELIEGMPLSAYTSYGRRVPTRAAVEIAAQVAQVLDVAWRAQGPDGRPLRVLHRDIKPSNLLLTQHGEVKVLDFGVAQASFDAREASTSKDVFGTITYMAPERLKATGGPGADVYALGVVLIEMLNGERFGPAPVDCVEYGPHLSAALQRLPPDAVTLAPLLRRMLAHGPDDRPTAAELTRALGALSHAFLSSSVSASDTDARAPSLSEWAAPAVTRYLSRRSSSEQSTSRRSWSTTSRRVFTRTVAMMVVITVSAGLALGAALGVFPRPSWWPAAVEVPVEDPPAPARRMGVRPQPLFQLPAPPPGPLAPPASPAPTGAAQVQGAATPALAAGAANVTLTGDLSEIVLVGRGGRFTVPGYVPPGRYRVEVLLPRWGERTMAEVEIPEGGTVVRCLDGFGGCGAD